MSDRGPVQSELETAAVWDFVDSFPSSSGRGVIGSASELDGPVPSTINPVVAAALAKLDQGDRRWSAADRWRRVVWRVIDGIGGPWHRHP